MIRMLIAMLLALGAFVGASLRFVRERDALAAADPGAPAPSVRTVELLPGPDPAPPPSSPPPGPDPAPPPAMRRAAPPRPDPVPTPRRTDPPPAPRPPQQPPVPPPLVEEVIEPVRAFAEAPVGDLSAAAPPPATAREPSLDQDAWADLIRRMLALYRRAGDPR